MQPQHVYIYIYILTQLIIIDGQSLKPQSYLLAQQFGLQFYQELRFSVHYDFKHQGEALVPESLRYNNYSLTLLHKYQNTARNSNVSHYEKSDFKLLLHLSSEFIAWVADGRSATQKRPPCWENHTAVQLISRGVSFSTPLLVTS